MLRVDDVIEFDVIGVDVIGVLLLLELVVQMVFRTLLRPAGQNARSGTMRIWRVWMVIG